MEASPKQMIRDQIESSFEDKSAEGEVVPWLELPAEIYFLIFQLLKPKDLILASRVCRQWNDLANDNSLWRENYTLDFILKPWVNPRAPPGPQPAPKFTGVGCLPQVGLTPLNKEWKELYKTRKQIIESCVWSVDAVIFNYAGTNLTTELGGSGFPSWVANVAIIVDYGKYYYEVILESEHIMQIGWLTSDCYPRPQKLEGVGDDVYSWAYDGHRQHKYHNRGATTWGKRWTSGQIVGCMLNLDDKEVLFSLDGELIGSAFTLDFTKVRPPFFAGFSMQFSHTRAQMILTSDKFKHKPAGYCGVADGLDHQVSVMSLRSNPVWKKLKQAEHKTEVGAYSLAAYWEDQADDDSINYDDDDNDGGYVPVEIHLDDDDLDFDVDEDDADVEE